MFVKGRTSLHKRLDVKLAVWYTSTFLTIILLIFGFLDYRLRHNLLKEIDRMLVDEGHEIINEVLKNPESSEGGLQEYGKIASNRRYYQIAFRLLDNQGKPFYAHPHIRGVIFPFAESSLDLTGHKTLTTENLEVPPRGTPFRLCTYYYRERGDLKYVVQTVTYPRMMKKNVLNFRRNLVTAFLLAFLFGSLGGWFLSRRTLRPIDKITATTKRITATSLSERLALHGTDDELDQLARTINEMLERLEESFQKLSQFTADAAHELRTPITALKGETEVLLSQRRSLEEYGNALAANLERLDFLTKLVNDLLLLSQADEGSQVLQVETILLPELLRELWDAFTLVAAQKEINSAFECSEELRINGDSLKLKQLFSNLIDNAIKYTPEGGEISLSSKRAYDGVKITLKDSGIGIPGDDLPRIFDRFYRVDKSRSRLSGGTGLGLSICQWIVKAHKGTIGVDSQPHQGTTFTVTLPTEIT